MNLKLFLLLPIIVFSQCKPKVYSLDFLSAKSITMGSYGGFAGTIETYIFLDNGQRFYTNSMTGDKELEPITKKQFNAMKRELLNLDFLNRELNEPGNMNYFIELITKKDNHKVLWSNPETAPKDLVEFMEKHLKGIQTQSIK